MLLGTDLLGQTRPRLMFQSPERIHAFGNNHVRFGLLIRQRFNPQRGFMLLGTFNPQHAIVLWGVSIPREDSCFWEPSRRATGLPTVMFQSPERIHAFGN